MKLFIRCYATNANDWDDGIGYMVVYEDERVIDQYIQHYSWKSHPYQTFVLQTRNKKTYYYGDVIIGKEIDD